jgi:hypothetical protein
MVKLYQPYGHLRRVAGFNLATIHWFVKDRETPVAPHAQLVESYAKLTSEAQDRAGCMVDEFFTAEEFGQLRDYLFAKHREDLRTGVVVPPVNGVKQDNDRNRKLIRPFSHLSEDENGGFYRLCDEPGYTLPFCVWGYFTRAS